MSPSTDLVYRVAERYLKVQSRSHPPRSAFSRATPEDQVLANYIVQLPTGSSITTDEVEKFIGRTRDVADGSCRFQQVDAHDRTNRVSFELRLWGGEVMTGRVEVHVASYAGTVTAYAGIYIDGGR